MKHTLRHSVKKSTVKRRRRKNPPPLFHNEIKALVGKTVTVQFGSENGTFGITNTLHDEKIFYRVSVDIEHKNFAGAQIMFNLFLVEKIIGNTIILVSSYNLVYDKRPILKWSDLPKYTSTSLISVLTSDMNIINLNSYLFIDTGLLFPTIRCKLSYNRQKDILYYSKLHKFYLTFKPSTIIAAKFREFFVDI